MSLGL